MRSKPAERHRVIVVEQNAETGPRLKFFSGTADVDYWTALWHNSPEPSYDRERTGHLPHQLRDTFQKYVASGSRVLEAGCGLGHFTVAADALGYGAEGLDWSDATIRKLRPQFPNIPWHVGDVRALQFDDGAFDAVYSPGVCEHFEEGPAAILTEMRRVLKPGGIGIVSTPCFNSWLQGRAEGTLGAADGAREAFYQYAFSPDGMAKLLGGLGFEVLLVRPYGSLTTMVEHAGWRVPAPAAVPLAVAMDYLPVVRDWGWSCLWVVRKPSPGAA